MDGRENDDATLKQFNDRNVIPAHRARFPLQANMKALMFLVSAELSEDHRGRLLSTLIQRGIRVPDYTIENRIAAIRKLFLLLISVVFESKKTLESLPPMQRMVRLKNK